MSLSRLIDLIMRRPAPPYDERSQRAAEIDALADDLHDVAQRVDRLTRSGDQSLESVLERRLASYARSRIKIR